MDNLKKEFWDRLEDVRACMLGLANDGPLIAMSPQVDDDTPGKVWFITAKETDLAKAVAKGAVDARMVVSDNGQGLYADIWGALVHSTDREELEEAWSFVADAWFEGGKNDPDVCLLCFTPASAQVWITPTSGVKFFYEMAKSNLTEAKPDMGEQGKIIF